MGVDLPANYRPKKNEKFMSDRQREYFRQKLTSWRTELLEDYQETLEHLESSSRPGSDFADMASAETDKALELRARDRERKLIKKIDDTVAKLDSDEYGYCAACGVEIGIRRLEARPTASLCIDCKTLDEIREKQMS